MVTLYRALGGGWHLAVPDWTAAPDAMAATAPDQAFRSGHWLLEAPRTVISAITDFIN